MKTPYIRILQGISLFFIFIISLVAFLPKENLYYALTEKLANKSLSISNETIQGGFFSLLLENGDVSFKNLDAFHFDTLTCSTTLLNTKFELLNTKFDGLSFEFIELHWVFYKPQTLTITIDGTHLQGSGVYDLKEKKLTISFIPSQKFKEKYSMLLLQGEQKSNGEYTLEYNL